MLNLNFSKLVNIGTYVFNIDGIDYQHELYITEDAVVESKYYLIDVSKNVTDKKIISQFKKDILLEGICIGEISIKKDMPTQIASFLYKLDYVDDIDYAADVLKNIDMSFFEVRYNFYKNGRVDKVDVIESGEVLCSFFKIRKISDDGSFGAVVEDMGLFNIKKMIYSTI